LPGCLRKISMNFKGKENIKKLSKGESTQGEQNYHNKRKHKTQKHCSSKRVPRLFLGR